MTFPGQTRDSTHSHPETMATRQTLEEKLAHALKNVDYYTERAAEERGMGDSVQAANFTHYADNWRATATALAVKAKPKARADLLASTNARVQAFVAAVTA